MKPKIAVSDSDILGSLPAMKRAAKYARKLAEATGAPFYVWENGRVVNLNPRKRKQSTAAKARGRRS